jgi:hypothetical protein
MIGVRAAEMQVQAEVGVPLFAHFTAPAGLGWIDRYPGSYSERVPITVQGIRANRVHDPGKLVTQDKWFRDRNVANPGILVGMQITTTNSNCLYPY